MSESHTFPRLVTMDRYVRFMTDHELDDLASHLIGGEPVCVRSQKLAAWKRMEKCDRRNLIVEKTLTSMRKSIIR